MNAQVELEKLISRFSAEGKTPSLLLHACCAPCASYCIEYLVSHFDLTLFYYNPNITERDEYDKRLKELERFAHEFGVNVIDGGFDPNTFFEHTKGLEREPERGGRCSVCFELRLKKTQEEANGKYDYFATTLTLSPLKNANLINAIGQSLQGEGTTYLPTDFKKREGYKRSIELSNKYGLYRQNYCGCVYSKK
ncbi:MAG: epoxyqueuosine reductase QueH [Clostridia bacterium]|nr:epoxyqueuosine reductase QueH [Clostridia bacterium]MBO7156080.1 epoxyqueuosine reductase QueH [Clostridia bacterium]